MPIYNVQKKPQTTTFPTVQAIEIKREIQTLLDLQALSIPEFTINLGPPGDTSTLIISIQTPSGRVNARKGNVLVKVSPTSYEVYEDQGAFLAAYNVLP